MQAIISSLMHIITAHAPEVKRLDWNKTAKEQGLKIGDTITIEGLIYSDDISREYDWKSDSDEDESVYIKKPWDAELHVPMYSRHYRQKPNVPIGVVVCTIFNPSAYEAMQKIDAMYPDKTPESPYISHDIKFEGTIHSFKREIVETSSKEVPKVSLASVRIHVTDLELISSYP